MSKRLKMAIWGTLAAVIIMLGGTAFASSIELEGTTSGTFAPGVNGMTFTGVNFDWTTIAAGTATVKLGTLTYNGQSSIYQVYDAFSLKLSFGDPKTVPTTKIFTAEIWAYNNGFWSTNDVWFDDITPTHFTFTTDNGYGSFDIMLAGRLSNGMSWPGPEQFTIHNWFGGSIIDVMANITNATFVECPPQAVPEPSTMLLLGFGLAGAAAARRKFRK